MERILAHVHIMKTAGQSLCDILRASLPGRHCDLRCGELATPEDLAFARWFYPRLQSIAGHSVRPHGRLAECAELSFYTVLREPIARSISHYQFLAHRETSLPDFPTWMRRAANYQTRFLSGRNSVDAAIEVLEERVGFVGLMEQFELSLQLWHTWSQLELRRIGTSRNIAEDNSIKQTILANDAWLAIAGEANQLDQQLYEYACRTMFPRQVKQYGQRANTASSDSTALAVSPPMQTAGNLAVQRRWDQARRDLLYKPAARFRQALRGIVTRSPTESPCVGQERGD